MDFKEHKEACTEYNTLSRRQVVKGLTFASVAAASGFAWLPRVAYAQNAKMLDQDIIVVVNLRGGADGLSFVAPHGEARYYELRPTIALPRPGSGLPGAAIDIDGLFGFNPALQPLMEAFNNKHLEVVHAVGRQGWSRSHFDAMKLMEMSLPDIQENTGWLGRHLANSKPMFNGGVRGVSLQGTPLALNGAPQAVPVDLSEIGWKGNFYEDAARVVPWLGTQYDVTMDQTADNFKNVRRSVATLEKINFASYVPQGGAVYDDTQLGMGLKSAAALIAAQVGVEAVHIDFDSWDTHADAGPIDGYLRNHIGEVGSNLAAFYRDLMSRGNQRFLVVVMSEFGRTIAENGARGNDHGNANCMFLLGSRVKGGRVFSRWPGFDPARDNEDLLPTTDYRDVLAEIVQRSLKNDKLAKVLPGYTPAPLGLFK